MKSVKLTFFVLLCTCVLGSGAYALTQTQESYLDELIGKARAKDLAHRREWLMLLHYHEGLFGGFKSDIDGPNFFLYPGGRTDPEGELDATLHYFFDPEPFAPEEQHPQCRFPARYAWLKEQLSFDASLMPERICGRFEEWKKKLSPTSVHLVFASYYMNNPASMYGHTFLRLGRESDIQSDLLDYTVNYAAKTNTNNGIAFAIRGLLGGFQGGFSTDPYYMKIQKYNNLESRDLWEFSLNLNQVEVDRLVAHLWEMGPTYMSYFFLNKNCSYQLLPILEVARPTLRLSNEYRFSAIPIDTVRTALRSPGLVSGFQMRPSHFRQLEAKTVLLSNEEGELARRMVKAPDDDVVQDIKALSSDRQAIILDTSYDYLHYRMGFQRFPKQRIQNLERQILLLRNALPSGTTNSYVVPQPVPPQNGHKSRRVDVGFGVTRASHFEEFNIRGAIHDLEDSSQGFIAGSELEMGRLTIRYNHEQDKLSLERLRFVEIKSFRPWDAWSRGPSWGINLGFENVKDLETAPSRSTFFDAGGQTGITLNVKPLTNGMAYFMARGDSGIGPVFSNDFRVGVGGRTPL